MFQQITNDNNINIPDLLKTLWDIDEFCHRQQPCLDAIRINDNLDRLSKNGDKYGVILRINPHGKEEGFNDPKHNIFHKLYAFIGDIRYGYNSKLVKDPQRFKSTLKSIKNNPKYETLMNIIIKSISKICDKYNLYDIFGDQHNKLLMNIDSDDDNDITMNEATSTKYNTYYVTFIDYNQKYIDLVINHLKSIFKSNNNKNKIYLLENVSSPSVKYYEAIRCKNNNNKTTLSSENYKIACDESKGWVDNIAS